MYFVNQRNYKLLAMQAHALTRTLLLQPKRNNFTSASTRKDLAISPYVLSLRYLPLPHTCVFVTVIRARSYCASTVVASFLKWQAETIFSWVELILSDVPLTTCAHMLLYDNLSTQINYCFRNRPILIGVFPPFRALFWLGLLSSALGSQSRIVKWEKFSGGLLLGCVRNCVDFGWTKSLTKHPTTVSRHSSLLMSQGPC
jgi:hypothetical protein